LSSHQNRRQIGLSPVCRVTKTGDKLPTMSTVEFVADTFDFVTDTFDFVAGLLKVDCRHLV